MLEIIERIYVVFLDELLLARVPMKGMRVELTLKFSYKRGEPHINI